MAQDKKETYAEKLKRETEALADRGAFQKLAKYKPNDDYVAEGTFGKMKTLEIVIPGESDESIPAFADIALPRVTDKMIEDSYDSYNHMFDIVGEEEDTEEGEDSEKKN